LSARIPKSHPRWRRVIEVEGERASQPGPIRLFGSARAGSAQLRWGPHVVRFCRISFILAAVVVLYGPLAILAVFSFNNSIIIALPFRGFTLVWYGQVLRDPTVLGALLNSVKVASLVMPISLVLGTLAAFGITRFRFRLKGLAAGLIAAPLIVPWLLIGVGGLLFFNLLHIQLSFWTMTAILVAADFPLVAALVAARLTRFDTSLEEAALDLGATPREVLRYVVLPMLAPALAAAGIIAFSWAFNNFTISFFTGGSVLTFPIWAYGQMNHAQNLPIVNAICTIIAACEMLLVYLAWRLFRRSSTPGASGVAGLLS
jgi:spermidine/putrescine transport system permease protein